MQLSGTIRALHKLKRTELRVPQALLKAEQRLGKGTHKRRSQRKEQSDQYHGLSRSLRNEPFALTVLFQQGGNGQASSIRESGSWSREC